MAKATDYLYNKEEIDMNSNLVAESKVTECNRTSPTIFMQKMSKALQEEYEQDYAKCLVQSMRQICLKCVQA